MGSGGGLWLSPFQVWGRQWHPPHGLGETTGGRLTLDLAPGSTPPSCVTLGQWCDLSESCVRGRSQSPGHPLGPPRRVTVPSNKIGFRLPPTAGLHPARPREAQGRNSEPSCRGRQTRRRHQGPRDEGKGAAGRGAAEEPGTLKGVLTLYNKGGNFKFLTRHPDQRDAAASRRRPRLPAGRRQTPLFLLFCDLLPFLFNSSGTPCTWGLTPLRVHSARGVDR